MKLKVSRFHTRARPLPELAPEWKAERKAERLPERNAAEDLPFDPEDDGFGDARFETAQGDVPAPPTPANSPEGTVIGPVEIDAIKREGLTGRQLRMARRLAQKNNLPATSDFDAVRLLRKSGLDPFKRSTELQLVGGRDTLPPDGQPVDPSHALTTLPEGDPNLPETIAPDQLPSPEIHTEQAHIAEVRRIQQDIVRRRRRKLVLLWARLAGFVLLPTLVAAWYYLFVATPLYTAHSEFVIQKSTPSSGAFAGLLQGTSFANSQDSVVVQGYLQSHDAMNRLDKDVGLRPALEAKTIDPLLRLPPHATDSQAYKLYRRLVKVSYDPTEGVVKMNVSAPKPALAVEYSKALISYAEQQVNELTQRLRNDQMRSARESFLDAQNKLTSAQAALVALQEKYKMLSSTSDAALLNTQISALQTQLNQDQISLAQMQSNARPNKARMDPLKNHIALLKAQIAKLRDQMAAGSMGANTAGSKSGASLPTIQSQLAMAQADVQTRQMMLAQATTALETARIEANRQTRYLSVSVAPALPDAPSYPRRLQDVLVVLLIFAGLYLMISMTIGILREQAMA